MVGLSDATTAFHSILWSDAELVGIAIDYSDVVVTLRESTGLLRRVICEGYVGYRTAGFWDEIVIMKAELEPQGEFVESCLQSLTKRLGADRASSGSDARNRSIALQLTVTLLDDCQLLVAMNGLRTEVVSEI